MNPQHAYQKAFEISNKINDLLGELRELCEATGIGFSYQWGIDMPDQYRRLEPVQCAPMDFDTSEDF